MSQVLDDVRIVDVSRWIPGDYCTKLFADFGADVIKVEKPSEGDWTRHYGPFPGDRPDPEKSALFLHLNTNKRSITLNLKSQEGKQILWQLILRADILVESFRPTTMESLGFPWEELHARNPRLVYTRISNFGQNGPYRDDQASGLTLQAMGGPMQSTGLADREPLQKPGNLSLYSIGNMAAEATMAALLVSKGQGQGQQIDVSGLEALLSSVDRRMTFLMAASYTGEDAPRGEGAISLFPTGAFPCADGYVMFFVAPAFFKGLLELLGDPQLLAYFEDPEAIYRPEESRARLDEVLYPWLMAHTKAEIMELAESHQVPITAVYTIEEMRNSTHFRERGFMQPIDHPVAGTLEYPGAPWRMRNGWALRRPAPRLGEQTEEILTELGYPSNVLPLLRANGVI